MKWHATKPAMARLSKACSSATSASNQRVSPSDWGDNQGWSHQEVILFSCQSGSQGGRFLIFTCQNPQKWKLIEVEGYKLNYRCSDFSCQSGFIDKISRAICKRQRRRKSPTHINVGWATTNNDFKDHSNFSKSVVHLKQVVLPNGMSYNKRQANLTNEVYRKHEL